MRTQENYSLYQIVENYEAYLCQCDLCVASIYNIYLILWVTFHLIFSPTQFFFSIFLDCMSHIHTRSYCITFPFFKYYVRFYAANSVTKCTFSNDFKFRFDENHQMTCRWVTNRLVVIPYYFFFNLR